MVGPLSVEKVPDPPTAEVLSIEIFVPPLAGTMVTAAYNKLGIKKLITESANVNIRNIFF